MLYAEFCGQFEQTVSVFASLESDLTIPLSSTMSSLNRSKIKDQVQMMYIYTHILHINA